MKPSASPGTAARSSGNGARCGPAALDATVNTRQAASAETHRPFIERPPKTPLAAWQSTQDARPQAAEASAIDSLVQVRDHLTVVLLDQQSPRLFGQAFLERAHG